jgi:hypothetical protein
MKAWSKLLLAGLIAALTLSIVSAVASALRSIEIGGRRELRETARRITFEGGGVSVLCEVTLEKTLNAAIAKTQNAQIGNVEMTVGNCEGGTLRALNTASGWPLRYKSFTGTLPRIGSVREIIEGIAALIEAFGGLAKCLYRGNEEITTGPNDRVTELRFDETVMISLFRNDGVTCPATADAKGTAAGPTLTLRLV